MTPTLIAILMIDIIISLIFAAIITGSASNYKVTGFGYYFLMCLLFTPLIAFLIAILDALTLSKK